MHYRYPTLPLNKLALVLFTALSMAGLAHADTALPTIDVYGNHDTAKVRDQAGYDAIYDANYSSDYAGSKVINAYRGTDPADLLRNFTGVYSGEARNGGAIDPNIRGVQGPGRVPVTVDGTEQAMVVSRGYNGMTNRNYIDPMLIGSIRIIKDGGYTGDAGFKASIGGGMAIRTIDAEDVLRGRLGFGGEIRLESSSNAAKFARQKNYNGWKYTDIPTDFMKQKICEKYSIGGSGACVYAKYTPIKTTGDSFNVFSGHDIAGRIALAYAKENWSVMGAYAYRQRGNYYAGKHNFSYYSTPILPWLLSNSIAKYFAPGAEVFNTASRTSSYLIKGKIRPDDAQQIELGWMHVDGEHGDILPRQLYTGAVSFHDAGLSPVAEQIPLSTIHLDAYHLNYALHPDKNKWIDLKVGLWGTVNKGYLENLLGGSYSGPLYKAQNFDENVLADTAKMQFKDTRYGFNVSNKMQLQDRLSLSLFGSLEHRKTFGKNPYYPYYEVATTIPVNRGRKTLGGVGFNWHITPTDRLTIDVGAKYSAYRLHDDGLKHLIDAGQYMTNGDFTTTDGLHKKAELGVGFKYTVDYKENLKLDLHTCDLSNDICKNNLSTAFYDALKNNPDNQTALTKALSEDKEVTLYPEGQHTGGITLSKDDVNKLAGDFGDDASLCFMDENDGGLGLDFCLSNYVSDFQTKETAGIKAYQKDIPSKETDIEQDKQKEILVMPRADGRYYFADSPCFNGEFDAEQRRSYCGAKDTGKKTDKVELGQDVFVDKVPLKPVVLHKGHAWAPFLDIAYQLTDSAKVYARYNESIRFPSITESTIFMHPFLSGREMPTGYFTLKPEHSHVFELGYTQNLLNWLPNAELADVKFSYYQNRINNAIDRLGFFSFINVSHMDTKGLEFTGRYDTGRFFVNMGINYLLESKVCDEDTAFRYSIYTGYRLPTCVQGGFTWGFLVNQTPPKLSTSLNLGTRLLDRTLELSTRVTYYTKYRNPDYDHLLLLGLDGSTKIQGLLDFSQFNPPFGWGNTLIFDAYARYKINKYFEAELSATNLTDQYYVDPANRSLMPAPGRTFKLSLTGRF